MTTEQQQPSEESSRPTTPMLNPPFAQPGPRPIPYGPATDGIPPHPSGLARHPDHQALLNMLCTTAETRYIALDVGAETFGAPAADRDNAIENLYDRLGYDGHDSYTGTIVIIEATGTPLILMTLDWINFKAGYMRLQNYQPDLAAKRRDAQAADIDESERLH